MKSMKRKIVSLLLFCIMIFTSVMPTFAKAHDFSKSNLSGPGMGGISLSAANGSSGEWVEDENGWWWKRADGSYPSNSWQKIGNYYYYFNSNGYMKSGWIKDNTGYYYTNSDGVWIPNAFPEVVEILSSGDLKKAYDYCVVPYAAGETQPRLGSRYYADILYNNRAGNCYSMAAGFAELARAMGYDARHMTGFVGMRLGGIGPHSWVEIDGSVYDPDFEAERGQNGFGIHYGQKGTWKYQNYSVMF